MLNIYFLSIFYENHTQKKLQRELWATRQQSVRDAFKYSWDAYVRDAWGKDQYSPVGKYGVNLAGDSGIGFMIVDALDTMLLMGFKDEYQDSRQWVQNELNFNVTGMVSLFETTIRVLGGLLSAYHLSGNDKVYLDKAKDLGDRLLGAFQFNENGVSPLPRGWVSLSSSTEGQDLFYNNDQFPIAEVATLQLEFKYLSHITGDPKYWEHVEAIMIHLDRLGKLDGLVPVSISSTTGRFTKQLFTVGGLADSYYEYLLKQYLLTSGTEPMYLRMYQEALRGIKKRLLSISYPEHLPYFGELRVFKNRSVRFNPKMEHLACFLGGTIALGATNGNRNTSALQGQQALDFLLATEFTRTCVEMYFKSPTGLGPEYLYFEMNSTKGSETMQDMRLEAQSAGNNLRPETVESLFVLWKITGDVKYREWGWQIFQAFEKYSKFEDGGYTSIEDVTQIPPKRKDRMETFWLAETLKYLYLLFEDPDSNLLPFNKYVFNTEAHPLPIFQPSQEIRGEGWLRS
ncbi:hypothetical protein G9A89_008272 [Geosiphon pyriformis]|nr:hypothetical protein G9A89_008272 [Geosiphon pyriformis]